MKEFWQTIWPWLKNKYVLTIAGFIIWLTFFSQYNLMERARLAGNLNDLQREKEYYIDQIKRDSARLHQLSTGTEELEKYAREQFYMKKPNEDIFVVVEE
jgi:cell division protein DivIC